MPDLREVDERVRELPDEGPVADVTLRAGSASLTVGRAHGSATAPGLLLALLRLGRLSEVTTKVFDSGQVEVVSPHRQALEVARAATRALEPLDVRDEGVGTVIARHATRSGASEKEAIRSVVGIRQERRPSERMSWTAFGRQLGALVPQARRIESLSVSAAGGIELRTTSLPSDYGPVVKAGQRALAAGTGEPGRFDMVGPRLNVLGQGRRGVRTGSGLGRRAGTSGNLGVVIDAGRTDLTVSSDMSMVTMTRRLSRLEPALRPSEWSPRRGVGAGPALLLILPKGDLLDESTVGSTLADVRSLPWDGVAEVTLRQSSDKGGDRPDSPTPAVQFRSTADGRTATVRASGERGGTREPAPAVGPQTVRDRWNSSATSSATTGARSGRRTRPDRCRWVRAYSLARNTFDV